MIFSQFQMWNLICVLKSSNLKVVKCIKRLAIPQRLFLVSEKIFFFYIFIAFPNTHLKIWQILIKMNKYVWPQGVTKWKLNFRDWKHKGWSFVFMKHKTEARALLQVSVSQDLPVLCAPFHMGMYFIKKEMVGQEMPNSSLGSFFSGTTSAFRALFLNPLKNKV